MYKKLIKWSLENYSDLPWRNKRSLYTTLVSEIMLQQTTVTTVMSHYDIFIKKYPTLKKLAAATEQDVCSAWQGLGYYRRARNLRNAAIDIVQIHKGKIPLEREELVKISGIGQYTASAIIAIGADQKALAIDANIERVVSRLYGIKAPKGLKLHKILNELFETNINKKASKIGYRAFNEALMDLGRTFCKARNVSCEICPCRNDCEALKTRNPLSYPEELQVKKKKYYELKLLRLIIKKKSRVLGYEKTSKEWLSGQIEIPTFVISTEDKSLKQYPELIESLDIKQLSIIKTSITKYKIQNYILEISYSKFKKMFESKEYNFHSLGKETHFSTTSRKCLEHKLL